MSAVWLLRLYDALNSSSSAFASFRSRVSLREPPVKRSQQVARLLHLGLGTPEACLLIAARNSQDFTCCLGGHARQLRKSSIERFLIEFAILKFTSEVIRVGLHVEIAVAR